MGRVLFIVPLTTWAPLAITAPLTWVSLRADTCVQADEMLYRAVLLTVVAFWLRDRLYEGGAEDTVTFAGGAVHLDLLTAGQWGALALGAAGGVLAFMLRAWREKAMVEKAEVRVHVLRHSDAFWTT